MQQVLDTQAQIQKAPGKQAAAYGTGSTQSLIGNHIGFIAEDAHSEDDSYGDEFET